jgi:hypothetical protein
MEKTRRVALILILLSSGFSVLWGSWLAHQSFSGMSDFRTIYYGSRCLLQRVNPYQPDQFLRVYRAEQWTPELDEAKAGPFLTTITDYVYPPTTLLIIAPFAAVPWEPAALLWLALTALSLTLGGFLIWSVAADSANRVNGANKSLGVSLFLVCVLLANCLIIFTYANAAGLVAGLCVVAVWCFLQERFVPAGIICLAVSLALKPHDAGLVWLYFLLAGGTYRKRALQTLAVTVVIGLPALLWVSNIAPHWLHEMQTNIQSASAHGALNDPGPASFDFRAPDPVIGLQSIISILRDDPRFYNAASYLVAAPLLLIWCITALRSRITPTKTWLALAAVATLTMLVSYHRQHDAKLLLLTVPGCALLWSEGGLMGWFALTASSAGFLITGDVPSMALILLTKSVPLNTASLLGKMETILLVRPSALILLVMAFFYLWAYVRRAESEKEEQLADAASL